MDRGSDTHGPAQDEYLKKELRGLEQADRPSRAEEWRDPEPPADDDPELNDPRGSAEEPAVTTVAEAMTPHVVAVSVVAPVAEAAELMRDNDLGSIFVIDDDGRVAGMITDRNLALRVLGEGRTPATTAVGDVYSTDLATVLADSSVAVADDIMRERAVRRLLVVGADDRPQGVVSVGDLAVTQRPWSALADMFLAEPPNNPEDG